MPLRNFAANDQNEARVTLRILATSDLHAHLMAYDYFADRPSNLVGLSRIATLIRIARAEAGNTVLFDNGDFLQGSLLADFIADASQSDPPELHPMIAAMNELDYDAVALGNHEFNYGLDFLERAISSANFPVICANVAREQGSAPTDDKTLVSPYSLLTRQIVDQNGAAHQLKIGVIAALPPQTVIWDKSKLLGRIQTRSIPETFRAYVPVLHAQGADIIVALSHSGIGHADQSSETEQASLRVAGIEGIDVVICGHTHRVFPGPGHIVQAGVDATQGTLHTKPAVMPGVNGSHLGVVDLELTHSNDRWQISAHSVEARPIAARDADGRPRALGADDPDVVAAAKTAHHATLAYIRQPAGQTSDPIQSYFAQMRNDRSLQIVNAAQTWFVREHIAGSDLANLPLLSAASPAKTGGRGGPENYIDIPKGHLARRDISNLYPFQNRLTCLRVSGATLHGWLERSAALFRQLTLGQQDQTLLNPAFASYKFDVIDGLHYQFDLSIPARYDTYGNLVEPNARRVTNLTYQSRALAPTDEFLVATNSFRVAGCDWIQQTTELEPFGCCDVNIREVITRYLTAHSDSTLEVCDNWQIKPMPNTSALFTSAPQAQRFLPDAPTRQIDYVSRQSDGFAQYRLHL